jgi:hypothetical protein
VLRLSFGLLLLLVLRLEAALVPQWELDWNSGRPDRLVSLLFDPEGNAFLIGYTDLTYEDQALVVKVSSTGAVLWSKIIPSLSNPIQGTLVDARGNLYLGLNYRGNTLLKIDPLGNELWRTNSFAERVKLIDAGDGNILVNESKIHKLTAQGQFLWSHPNQGGQITTDASRNIYQCQSSSPLNSLMTLSNKSAQALPSYRSPYGNSCSRPYPTRSKACTFELVS